MTLFICPRCQQRAVRASHSGDFIHTCFGAESLRNEDILIIGDWEDYTGSDVNVGPNALKAGQENRLQGTRSEIEGAKEPGTRTSRGFPSNRFRTRQHLHYIEDSFFKKREIKRVDNPQEFL